MNAKTSKACDGCRLRKVKCNGQQPCQQCEHLNLACTFSAPKNRRQIVRGSRLAQLQSPREQTRPQPIAVQPSTTPSWRHHDHTDDFFYGLLDDYERVVYPVNPVIARTEMVEAVKTMNQEAMDAALVYAYAAVTVNLSQVSSRDMHGDVIAQIGHLMARSFAARARVEVDGDSLTRGAMTGAAVVSVRGVMACIFLEICLMAFKKYERAFVVLREAISMIQILEVQGRKSEARSDAHIARRQRLYWEAFIHERFLTIMTSYPSVLPPLPSGLPVRDPNIAAHVHVGFSRIIKLFLIIDDDVLRHWMAQGDDQHDRPVMTAAWIEHKQQQLDDDEEDAADDEESGLTELQVADLFITRLWLRTLIWQLAMSHWLLSSSPLPSAHEGLSLSFPAQRLSTQLQRLLLRLEIRAASPCMGRGYWRSCLRSRIRLLTLSAWSRVLG